MFVTVVPGKAFVGLMKKGGSSWSAFCGGWCVFEFHRLSAGYCLWGFGAVQLRDSDSSHGRWGSVSKEAFCP